MKKLISVLLSLVLLSVTLTAFPVFADDAPASILFMDGDHTSSTGWTGVRHRTKSDGSDEKLMTPDPTHAMAATNGWKAEMLDYASRYTLRTGGYPGVDVSAIPAENLAFAFWVYTEEEVKLNSDFYLEIGGASDGGWKMYPASGAFSTGDNTLHEGWNYFYMDFGKALAGDQSAGRVEYLAGSGAFAQNGGSPDDPTEGSYIYFDIYNCCVTSGQEKVNLWFDDLRFLNTAKLTELEQGVGSEEALRAVLENGKSGLIRLTDTVNAYDTFTVKRDVILDMDTFTVRVSGKPVFTADGASLTLKNGNTARTESTHLVYAKNGANVKLEGNITANGFTKAVIEVADTAKADLSNAVFAGITEGTENADIRVDGKNIVLAAKVNTSDPIAALSAFERYSDGTYDYYYKISPNQTPEETGAPDTPDDPDGKGEGSFFYTVGTVIASLAAVGGLLFIALLLKKKK